MAATAAPAATQAPCWRKVINDWLDDERIEGVYEQHCYQEATRHVPEDLRAYSSIVEDITSARQQSLRLRRPASSSGSTKNNNTSNAATKAEPNRELFKVAFNKVGPRNADSVPLPLLILAALALLLIAAGAAGLVAKRLRTAKISTPAPKP